jgi:predicted amidohydrolase
MRFALAQIAPEPRDLQANSSLVVSTLLAHRSCDVAVFPELFLSGYQTDNLDELAIDPDGAGFDQIKAAAADSETAALVGFAMRSPTGIKNSLAVIDRSGKWVGAASKVNLFGDHERESFEQGEALKTVLIDGVRLGLQICFDMEFPEMSRQLTEAGADVLITSAANMDPYGREHWLAARARALDNRRPHLYVNRIGNESGFSFVGGSLAVASNGDIIDALGTDESVAEVEIDISPSPLADENDYLTHLRRDLTVQEL